MRRRPHGSAGSQSEPQDTERVTGTTSASSDLPRSSGSGTGATTSYGQSTAPASRADYGMSGQERRPATSRHGSALSILAGSLAFLEGLAFVIRSHYYHGLPGYAYRWTIYGWGWVLLILGALLVAGGVSHLLGIKGSRHFTAAIAVITAVVAFITLFYSIIWGIVVLAASGFAAHSLLSDRGMEGRYETGTGPGGYGSRAESYQGMSEAGKRP
jgi:hypothetical protein